MTPFQQYLASLYACTEAREWVGERTIEQARAVCERPDWMLWLLARLPAANHRRTVGCTVEIVRRVLPVFEQRYPDDKRLRACLDTVQRWAEGDVSVTQDNLLEARCAAYATDATDAAYTAAGAAAAAYTAAGAAYATDATDAAYATADAAADAADAADRAAFQRESCDIIRRWFDVPRLPT